MGTLVSGSQRPVVGRTASRSLSSTLAIEMVGLRRNVWNSSVLGRLHAGWSYSARGSFFLLWRDHPTFPSGAQREGQAINAEVAAFRSGHILYFWRLGCPPESSQSPVVALDHATPRDPGRGAHGLLIPHFPQLLDRRKPASRDRLRFCHRSLRKRRQ